MSGGNVRAFPPPLETKTQSLKTYVSILILTSSPNFRTMKSAARLLRSLPQRQLLEFLTVIRSANRFDSRRDAQEWMVARHGFRAARSLR